MAAAPSARSPGAPTSPAGDLEADTLAFELARCSGVGGLRPCEKSCEVSRGRSARHGGGGAARGASERGGACGRAEGGRRAGARADRRAARLQR